MFITHIISPSKYMHCDWWMLLAIFQYTALTCSLSHMPINLWDKTIFLLASYSQSILNVTDPHFPHWLTVNALHTEAINQWQKNLVCNSQYIPWTRFIVHNTVEPQFIVKTTPGRTCYYTVWLAFGVYYFVTSFPGIHLWKQCYLQDRFMLS